MSMERITITRAAAPLRARIALPRSKSVSNRALLIASLLGDMDLVTDLSDGDDTRVMRDLLRERPAVMDCGAGGTTFRFLLAWASVQPDAEHIITGIPRLLHRPHDDLVQALRTLGADITPEANGFRVRGRKMPGGSVHFDSPISSQYISALLLIAPCLEQGLQLRWTGTRLSEPFVHMTLKMLYHFGVRANLTLDGVDVPPGCYVRRNYTVPPDWSSAAFWFEQVALDPGAEVCLTGLEPDTLQGDREAVQLWAPWVNCTSSAEGLLLKHRTEPGADPTEVIHMQHVPDLFQPLAFTLAGRGADAVMTGLDNLVVKETDRLRAVGEALQRLGCTASRKGGSFIQSGSISLRVPFTLDPDIDHRMALAVAPLALVVEQVTIHDPSVVDKSYPAYWQHLRQAGYDLRVY